MTASGDPSSEKERELTTKSSTQPTPSDPYGSYISGYLDDAATPETTDAAIRKTNDGVDSEPVETDARAVPPPRTAPPPPPPETMEVSEPGAFPHGGPPPEDHRPERNNATTNPPAVVVNEPEEGHEPELAVATQVQQQDLPRAQGVDLEAAELRRKEELIRMQRNFLILLVALLVAALIAVVVLLIRSSSSDDNTKTTEAPPPASPASAALEGYDSYVLNLLPDQTVQFIHGDMESPQSKALEWLLEEENILSTMADWRIVQRYVLAVFYYATKGPDWGVQNQWLSHSLHECAWWPLPTLNEDIVVFQGLPNNQRNPCGIDISNHSVTTDALLKHLWMIGNNLEAKSLPQELFLLTDLESLILDSNPIAGTIPTQLGTLSNLQVLGLTVGLTGTIPTELGNMENIVDLDFTYNHLTGTIPTELGLLSNSFAILLDSNPLTGFIPSELGYLSSNIGYLYFGDTDVQGKLPTELGLLSYLEYLDVYMTFVSGTIPTEFGQLESMKWPIWFDNYLTGTIPTELGLMTKLTRMDLFNNFLTGPIPSEFGMLSNLNQSISYIVLSGNDLSGQVPTELGLLSSLQFLYLNGNPNLSGIVPESVCSWINETVFDCSISNTTLCGCDCDCSTTGITNQTAIANETAAIYHPLLDYLLLSERNNVLTVSGYSAGDGQR